MPKKTKMSEWPKMIRPKNQENEFARRIEKETARIRAKLQRKFAAQLQELEDAKDEMESLRAEHRSMAEKYVTMEKAFRQVSDEKSKMGFRMIDLEDELRQAKENGVSLKEELDEVRDLSLHEILTPPKDNGTIVAPEYNTNFLDQFELDNLKDELAMANETNAGLAQQLKDEKTKWVLKEVASAKERSEIDQRRESLQEKIFDLQDERHELKQLISALKRKEEKSEKLIKKLRKERDAIRRRSLAYATGIAGVKEMQADYQQRLASKSDQIDDLTVSLKGQKRHYENLLYRKIQDVNWEKRTHRALKAKCKDLLEQKSILEIRLNKLSNLQSQLSEKYSKLVSRHSNLEVNFEIIADHVSCHSSHSCRSQVAPRSPRRNSAESKVSEPSAATTVQHSTPRTPEGTFDFFNRKAIDAKRRKLRRTRRNRGKRRSRRAA